MHNAGRATAAAGTGGATAHAVPSCSRTIPARRCSRGACGCNRREGCAASRPSSLVARDALLDGAEDAGARIVEHLEANGIPELEERRLRRTRLHLLDKPRFHKARI